MFPITSMRESIGSSRSRSNSAAFTKVLSAMKTPASNDGRFWAPSLLGLLNPVAECAATNQEGVPELTRSSISGP
jgi:hypothetical protein